MNLDRRYDIDWLRVIAIALLLIYHIAIVFQPWALFIGFIRSEELLEGIWTPMTLLNVWRIPLLFFVSGMGVYFAMRKRNVKQLLLERGKRILLPYLFGFIAIVPLHFFIFQGYYGQDLYYFPHSGHLWFLGNIAIYVAILFPLFFYLKRNQEGRFHRFLSKLMSNPLGPLSITVFFVLEVLIVKPQFFSFYAETLHGYVIGFLAFFFGFILVYTGKAFWTTMLRWKYLYLGLALGLFLVRLFVYDGEAPYYQTAIESNLWIFGVFGLAHQYLNKPSAALTYLSKSVYPVYIIHMFVLYGASSIILPLSIPVFLKFILIVISTFIICFAIYEFVLRRIPFLSILFGINSRKKKTLNLKDSSMKRVIA